MKLNDNAASPVVINEVGDNGELHGGEENSYTSEIACASGNPPYLNGAFYFEPEGNYYIVVPDSAALSITGDLTIAFTMKRNGDNSHESLICKGITDGQRSYSVSSMDSGRLLFYITPNGTQASRQYCITGDVLADSSWQRIVVTYDADGAGGNGLVKCYIDGVEKTFTPSGTIPSSIHDSTEDLYIAKGLNDYLAGKLDNIIIDAKVWMQENVNWDWNDGNCRELGHYHRVYRGQDGIMDYDNVQAVMDIDDSQVQVNGQELPANTIWHYIRRQVSGCGLESEDSPTLIITIDENGDMVGSTPNPPDDLTLEKLAGAKFKLQWRYTPTGEEIEPTGFRVYIDSGDGFNFESPADTVPYMLGRNGEFNWTSDELVDGQMYRFCVRSYREAAGESQNTNYVADFADSQGPDAITGLRISYQEA